MHSHRYWSGKSVTYKSNRWFSICEMCATCNLLTALPWECFAHWNVNVHDGMYRQHTGCIPSSSWGSNQANSRNMVMIRKSFFLLVIALEDVWWTRFCILTFLPTMHARICQTHRWNRSFFLVKIPTLGQKVVPFLYGFLGGKHLRNFVYFQWNLGRHRLISHFTSNSWSLLQFFWKAFVLKVPDNFFVLLGKFFLKPLFWCFFLKHNFCCCSRRKFLEGWRVTGAWRQDWMVFVESFSPETGAMSKRSYRGGGGEPLSISGRRKIHFGIFY